MFKWLSLIAGIGLAGGGVYLFLNQRRKGLLTKKPGEETKKITKAEAGLEIDSRYAESLIEMMNSAHIAGHLFPLEKVAITPEFYTLPRPFDPTDTEFVDADPFSLIPRHPEWPEFLSSYPIPGFDLDTVHRSTDSLLLLGGQGSGRTTALNLLALKSARSSDDTTALYFDLRDLDLTKLRSGEPIDLVRTLNQVTMYRNKQAGRLNKALQPSLEAGSIVLLCDGWDDLPTEAQNQSIDFIKTLKDHFPRTQIIMTGPVAGYGPLLTGLGFTPLFITPWNQSKNAELMRKWIETWGEITTGGEYLQRPSDRTQNQILLSARGSYPIDTTLRLWATLAGDDPGKGQAGIYEAYIRRVMPPYQMERALEKMAIWQLNHPDARGMTYDDASPAFNQAKAESGERIGFADFMYSLLGESRLLIEWGPGKITFAHPRVLAYLCASSMSNVHFDADIITDGNPLNDIVMAFLAQMRDIHNYVDKAIDAYHKEPGLRHEALLRMARWATHASGTIDWQEEIIRLIGSEFLAPSQFPYIREQMMCALVAASNQTAIKVLSTGLNNPTPEVRINAALGLGGTGAADQVARMSEFLTDENAALAVAATLGLGAIGSNAAIKSLIEVLLTGTEMARRAAAEMLHLNQNDEGHEILREAVEEEDHDTRRAAVYGLARIGGEDIAELLGKVERLDGQWIVRNTATSMLEDIQKQKSRVIPAPPKPENIDWITNYFAKSGEALSGGSAGGRQLTTILEKGSPAEKLGVSEVLGLIGVVDAVSPLYSNLRDEHAEIRDASFRSLGRLSSSYRIRLAYPG